MIHFLSHNEYFPYEGQNEAIEMLQKSVKFYS